MQATKSARNFQEMSTVFGLSGTNVPTAKKQPKKEVVKEVLPDNKSISQYRLLKVYEGVVFKLPSKKGMNYKPAFTAANGDSVSKHWHEGKGLGQGVFLNINFYKVTQKDLGKSIVTIAKVFQKIMADGRKFIMLDVVHTPEKEDECQYDFKMPVDGTGDFEIDPRVKTRIYFKPRGHNRLYSQTS